MSWTRRRILAAVVLYAIYAQRLYQYLLSATTPPFDDKRPVNLVPLQTIHG